MSCGSGCNCCPKCGCSVACRCSGRIMNDFLVKESAGDYSFLGINAPVVADNCDKCANGGVCDCGKKSRMGTVSGENCDKCANGGVCDCGKKSKTVAQENCDKCANGGTCNCGKN
ncbi:hypothetical protein O6H91_05G006300 [Diphasiastrum complanatum]|uniref:Uncharacterized protein n=1 Tax=Diphasiastrum complanatum TaxID=34168 RepID=A0ACC2DKG2_DIPCM|nr:hypothetical protein O6H91_05G006300 [Diphasiastrum complanatum]